MEPDGLLIHRWRSGSPEAAVTLVQRHYPRTLNFLYRLTGTRDQAEELTQEVFARLTRYVAGETDPIEDMPAWLNRVALNLWRDWVRREARQREKGMRDGDADLAQLAAPDAVEPAALDRWLQQMVRQAVLELDPKHREVLVLCHYQGLSPGEAAALLGVPVGTVKSRIHYAVRVLRRRLGPVGQGG
ncbi:MAG: RNA polymerase sigma factor [Symbiobacteriia bacterium]